MRRREETPPSLVIVTACSATKLRAVLDPPTYDDLVDPERRRSAEQRLAGVRLPAVDLYGGEHHLSIVRDWLRLREALPGTKVDLAIVSAGYGALDASDQIVPYDATFSNLARNKIAARADALGLPAHTRQVVGRHAAAVFVLGEDYLQAIGAPLLAAPLELYLAPIRPPIEGPGVMRVSAGFPEARSIGTSPRMVKAVVFRRLVDLIREVGWAGALAQAASGELLGSAGRNGRARQLPLNTW